MPLVVCEFGGGSQQAFRVRLTNFGRSVALSVVATVASEDGEETATVRRETLSAGDEVSPALTKDFSPTAFRLQQSESYELSTAYVSALGQQFQTVRTVTRKDGGPPVTSTATWMQDPDTGERRRLF